MTETPWSPDLAWPAELAPFDPFDTAIQADPYGHYAWMRQNAPVLRAGVAANPFYLVSRFDDVRAGLRNVEDFSSAPSATVKIPGFILTLDPPEHTALRQAVQQAFTPRALAALQPIIAELVQTRWRTVLDQGGGELMGAFASPLTIAVISTVLGVPMEHSALMREWTTATIEYMGALFRGVPDSKADSKGLDNIIAYIGAILDRADAGADTVVSNLARLRDRGELTPAEVTGYATTLFMAGHETTTLLTGNCLDLLAGRPDGLDLLRTFGSKAFLDEMLRYRPPVHRLSRVARRETELGGYAIPAGAHVRFLIASANRDANQFPDPDGFDPGRNVTTALGFGNGIHMCIGSWLAKLEAGLILDAIAASVEIIAPDETWPRMPLQGGAFATVGLHSLGVKLIPR